MSNQRITRRDFIRKSTVASAGVVAAGQLGIWGADVQAAQDFKGEKLRIFTYAGAWGDQFTKNFAPLFKELTGADLIVELGWWDSIPKLKASPPGNPAFDLIMTDATQGYPAIREGLFQKVDMGNIPNAGKFAPEVMSNWVVEESWGVTWPDAAQTGVFNTEDVEAAPQRWSQLLDREVRRQARDVQLVLLLPVHLRLHDGGPGRERGYRAGRLQQRPRQGARVREVAARPRELLVAVLVRHGPEPGAEERDHRQHPQRGCLTPVREGEPIGVFVPEKDRASFQALWLVSRDTKKNDLAEKAIDIFCSERFQEIYASDGGFPTAIPSVAATVGAKDALWAQINPYKPEHFQNVGYYPYDAYFSQWDHIVEVWDKEVLRSRDRAGAGSYDWAVLPVIGAARFRSFPPPGGQEQDMTDSGRGPFGREPARLRPLGPPVRRSSKSETSASGSARPWPSMTSPSTSTTVNFFF